jgi:L-threonylcarbamoyladenylate synthase
VAHHLSVHRWQLHEAAQCVRAGGLVAYPTEAVYGLGCDPGNRTAVERLLRLKRRSAAKGLILIAADGPQLAPWVQWLDPPRMTEILATWPGPCTWVLPAASRTPRWLTGGRDTLAVRVTAHPIAAALCRTCGTALVSTSANLAGRSPARSPLQVRLHCPAIDYILHGPLGGLARPSIIRDGATGRLIRA